MPTIRSTSQYSSSSLLLNILSAWKNCVLTANINLPRPAQVFLLHKIFFQYKELIYYCARMNRLTIQNKQTNKKAKKPHSCTKNCIAPSKYYFNTKNLAILLRMYEQACNTNKKTQFYCTAKIFFQNKELSYITAHVWRGLQYKQENTIFVSLFTRAVI